MGQRMFVSIVPPEPAVEDLAEFLAARPEMPWIDSEQWHLTLAFCESVPEHRIDDFAEALGRAAAKVDPFELRLAGGGVFPSVERAKVVFAAVDASPGDVLTPLARGARNAAAISGGAPDGRPFHPHLTLARLKRPIEATKWLRVLDAYSGPRWTVDEIELVASHLREGPNRRPRHETVAYLPLGVK